MHRLGLIVVILLASFVSLTAQPSSHAAACAPIVTLPGTPAPNPFRMIVVLPTATLSATGITDAYATADAVFAGHVVTVSSDNDPNVAQRATLLVKTVWKGEVATYIDVIIPRDTRTSYSDCDILTYPNGVGGSPAGYWFVPDNEFLVFMRKTYRGFEAMPGTGTLAAMSATVAAFEAGYNPQPLVLTPLTRIVFGLVMVGSVLMITHRIRKRP